MAWSSRTVVVANTSFNRTWTTRAVVPRPAPYYRAGGPYPAGRAPIGGTYNRNVNVNVNNNTVNNVNRNTANVNRNTANVNRNTADANRNTANRNRADVNQGSADRIAADNSNRNHRGGGGQIEAGNRGYSRPAEGRSSAFSGAQNGRSEQSASRRGQASRGSRQR
jgi:hypothetical protein